MRAQRTARQHWLSALVRALQLPCALDKTTGDHEMERYGQGVGSGIFRCRSGSQLDKGVGEFCTVPSPKVVTSDVPNSKAILPTKAAVNLF